MLTFHMCNAFNLLSDHHHTRNDSRFLPASNVGMNVCILTVKDFLILSFFTKNSTHECCPRSWHSAYPDNRMLIIDVRPFD